jgi:hypothetical protein
MKKVEIVMKSIKPTVPGITKSVAEQLVTHVGRQTVVWTHMLSTSADLPVQEVIP